MSAGYPARMSGPADTPMMRQYLDLKAQVPDALLFYRMGDFYELFFDDARKGAELMELTLTSRNKNDPDPIPMCGVPHHALDEYLVRVTEAGIKVAIAEQSEDPVAARAAGKTLVDRKLVRVVTPGLPLSPDDVDARESCWLVSVSGTGPVGLCFLDVSTGDLRVSEVPDLDAAQGELQRMEPREILRDPATPESVLPPRVRVMSGTLDPSWFDAEAGHRALCDLLGVLDLLGYGGAGLGPALAAAGALILYARDVSLVDLGHVRSLRVTRPGGHLVLDEATRRNLELIRPLTGAGRKGTLLSLLDRTATAMGGRMLREWIAWPLTDLPAIHARQDAVEALLDSALRRNLRERLKTVADLERLASKVSAGTINPRELMALATSLDVLPGIRGRIEGVRALRPGCPEDLLTDVVEDARRWLVDEPPTAITEGGYIRRGAHPELDEVVDLALEGKGAIAAMEAREQKATGIQSLKIRHNRNFGYYIEVTQANLDKVPKRWFRKQTLTNAERFTTDELKEFEEKVLGADERRKAMEQELYGALRDRVAGQIRRIQTAAAAVAWLDAISALAEVAVTNRYVRPEVDASGDLEILAGRHPVVEAMGFEERFVPNDVVFNQDRRLIVLTGPNMAGKSTVMRQVALITLMAQMGSFVPAERARVGLCDRVFVRVGASDDLAGGRSTFMVEMSETALILNQATSRSLILLDEIGRGTSTYDGLAIAWAVAEAVHDRLRCRALFATHYHELIALADELPRACNQHIAVSEWGERVVFLRTLKEGGASRSYGIQCARLAGLPDPVVERARALLLELERRPRAGAPAKQLSLFGARENPRVEPQGPTPAPPPDLLKLHEDWLQSDPLRRKILGSSPDELTPRQALEMLYQLREIAAQRAAPSGGA